MEGYFDKAKRHFKAALLLYANGYNNDALSRLYYSFRSLAIVIVGIPVKGKWRHQGLVKKFVMEVDRRGIFELTREERHLIKRFPDEREKADYDPVKVPKEKVERYIQLVERLIREVEEYAERDYKD